MTAPSVADRARIALLASGGLDSSILLGSLLQSGHQVQPFYIRSHLVWERDELRALKRFLRAMQLSYARQLDPLVVLELPLHDIYQGHWSVTGCKPPDAASADEAVYLPGRNATLLVKVAVWCQMHGIRQIAIGTLGSSPFADASCQFVEQFQMALNTALDAQLEFLRPLAHMHKRQVMELGRQLPLQSTFSCIAPIDGLHCGQCNKCAERQAAFRDLHLADPTSYASALNADR